MIEFDSAGGTFAGQETFEGDITGSATATGTQVLNEAGNGLDGSGRRWLDATIEGVGSGMIVIDDTWTSTFDGAARFDGTIVAGTDDFLGATGTWQSTYPVGSNDLTTDPTETGGPYTVELTLPPEPTQVDATGSWSDAGYTETPRDDGSYDVTYVTTMEGDIRGESSPVEAFRTPVPESNGGSIGGGRMVFSGEIDGLGTGTLTYREEYISLPAFLSVAVIVDGTGDFAGAGGWALFNPDNVAGTYEFHIEIPPVAPSDVPTRTIEASATSTRTDETEIPTGDDTFTYTGSEETAGDIVGTRRFAGRSTLESGGTGRGVDTSVFTGSIEGVGSGTMTFETVWRADPATGDHIGVARITGGTDDFAGAGGSVRYQSEDGGQTMTVSMELELPEG